MNYWILGILIVLIFIFLFVIVANNNLNVASLKVEEASSDIDVALEKRYDLLTKMIDTVKSYCKYEKDTFSNVIAIRQGMTIKEKDKANKSMDDAFSKIHILAENYPNLKASENYKMLQSSIADCEEHLQAAKRLYNANVSSYNRLVVSFPTSVIAGMTAHEKLPYYSIDSNKRNDVKIDI